jgi:hypothetical protein
MENTHKCDKGEDLPFQEELQRHLVIMNHRHPRAHNS